MKKKPQQPQPSRGQRGGFFLGLIVGLLVGLGLALGVALYISKVPVPFVNKVPQRTAEQDAAEAEKNKNWDPNNGLYGRNPAKPASSSSGGADAGAASQPTPVPVPPPVASAPPTRKDPRDPADILADKPWPAPASDAFPPPPEGGVPKASASSSVDYFVQAGAFSNPADAEQQRGKLALMGLQSRVNERIQAGRPIFRVRVGPFDKREDANQAKDRLDAAGIEAALVQVQKTASSASP